MPPQQRPSPFRPKRCGSGPQDRRVPSSPSSSTSHQLSQMSFLERLSAVMAKAAADGPVMKGAKEAFKDARIEYPLPFSYSLLFFFLLGSFVSMLVLGVERLEQQAEGDLFP